ncbi:patatin-like phospholipase family protein [candidate division WOR-3 bacterium]|nr:patatin-like phospholipase family protein [candidate division WOR-3 bacterium]
MLGFEKKIGFVFSGGAARIAQECALTEALVEGMTPSGKKVRPHVIAGTSSGGLNAVALNAVLRTKDGMGGKHAFDWHDYQRILFSLTDGNVFDITPLGIGKIIIENIPAGFVLDTKPLRKLLSETLSKMGFDTLGSLYLPTYISVVDRYTGKAYRLFSRDPDPSIRDLPLLDVLMATAAIPVAFEPVKIKGFKGEFFDGGVGRDGIPVEAMIDERCSDLYLITRMRGDETMVGVTAFKEKRPKIPKILLNTLLAMEYMMNDLFECEVDIAPRIARRAYLYLPKLYKQYPLLGFNTQRKQYEETLAWARNNDPVRIKKAPRKVGRRLRFFHLMDYIKPK